MLYRVHPLFKLTTSVVKGTDCTGNCKSNYHTITTIFNLQKFNIDRLNLFFLLEYYVLCIIIGQYLDLHVIVLSFITGTLKVPALLKTC